MTRRLIAGPLWFVAVSSLITFAETLLGEPRQYGAIIGVMVGAFVMFDPLGTVWKTRDSMSSDPTTRRTFWADRVG